MKSLIHRILVSILTIALVYAFLPAQKVLADPLSVSSDALGTNNYMVLQRFETAFVTISGGTKSYGMWVTDPDVASAARVRDTIFVIGIAAGESTLITVCDHETDEEREFYVFVIASKVLETPVLNVAIEGNTVTASWSQVPGADGYILYLAPFEPNPYRPYLTGIYSADLGDINTIFADLPSGSAYYVIIQAYAYGTGGFSNFSNLGDFIVE